MENVMRLDGAKDERDEKIRAVSLTESSSPYLQRCIDAQCRAADQKNAVVTLSRMEEANVFVTRCYGCTAVVSQINVVRVKRKRWRQNDERSPVILFVLNALVLVAIYPLPVFSFNDDENWKTSGNGFTSRLDSKNLNVDDRMNKHVETSGTKWASASEEAADEHQDAEIFRAVVNSIAEWEKRRRLRKVKKQLKTFRSKRSQPEKVDTFDDNENKELTQVCYAELGCFQEAGYIDLLPNSPDEVNTRYLLYNSRKSRGDTPLFDVSAQNISSLWEWVGKAFNTSAPTKVIVHGFGSSCSNVWVYEMRSALMSVEDCNIICVDWEAGATIPNYVRAAANTRLVGKQVAILLSGLEKYVNLSVRNVHVIGFSLGAHVAGFAGSELKNLSRITGLDPAGPLFESQDRRARLDSMDAQFVDVIHSNGENLILGGLGAWQPMGHVDFYPNGGRMQKGCTNLFVGAVSDMIWSANEVYGRSLCNHRRAYKFFTDSVSPKCQFPAVPCESYNHFVEGKCFPCDVMKDCSNMGYYADKFAGRGTLFLLTRDEEPFCANQYVVKVENTPDTEVENDSVKSTTFGQLQITLIGDLDLNETFIITQKKDEKLVIGESVSRIIVPHPALKNFLKIQVLYIAYKGWLSSGQNIWKISKISLTKSYDHVLSVCGDLTLESGVPISFHLLPKNCQVSDNNVNSKKTIEPPDLEMNLSTILDDRASDHAAFSPFPHTEVVHIGNEILSMNDAALRESLTLPKDDLQKLIVPDNVTHIDVGVAEYQKDSWKQSFEFPKIPTVNNYNNLDGIGDINVGESHFILKNSENVNGSSILNDTKTVTSSASPVAENYSIASRTMTTVIFKKQSPYEFIVSKQLGQSETLPSPNFKIEANISLSESRITEPILKPKSSTTIRSHQLQNMYRPSHGKSINVNGDWSAMFTTDAISTDRKMSGLLVSVSGVPSNDSEFISGTRANTEIISAVNASNPNSTRASVFSDRSHKESSANDIKNTTSLVSQSFVVQFLPQKLISFFEQAEKYARLAYVPFISSSDNSKNNLEHTRSIPVFGTNRRISSQFKNKLDSYDIETGESKLVTSVISAPFMRVMSSSFPYAYHVHQQYLWQHISQLSDHNYKYIPLANKEEYPSEKSLKLV